MRFKDFSPAERSILLNALDNQIQWLRGQLSVPADPGHWQSAHDKVHRQRRIELEFLKELRSELAHLVVVDLNS